MRSTYGEVKREAEAYGVCGGQFRHGDVGGGLVRDQRVLGRLLAVVARRELRQVPVVVALFNNNTLVFIVT